MGVSEADLSWIVGRVRAVYNARQIYLIGSQARGDAHNGSDIDLLIVGPSRLPRHRRGLEVAAALAAFPKRFDLLFYSPEELDEDCRDRHSFIATAIQGARRLFG